MQITNVEALALAFTEGDIRELAVQSAAGDIFIIAEGNEDGDLAYQGFPQAEDEDGDITDPNGGWVESLPAIHWPLQALSAPVQPAPSIDPGHIRYRAPWFLSNDNGDETWVITDGVETFPIHLASPAEFGVAVAGTIERAVKYGDH